ncbi:MAG: allantoinase [Gammaproteobacteria bacterium]|jgi:peptidoglycan/xylan/chitin deacetylase (PgdA/CDA1 family)|nr:allantoinase [Gammaproteobacteria bacterium]
MNLNGQRDLVGYGRVPPQAAWPNEARIAVNFVLNIEEGSEYSIGDGDGFSEATVTEFDASYVPRGERDLAAESMFEYGSRVGVWRVLRLFEEYGLPLTLNACALAVERHPELAAVIREKEYDICCHGWRWVDHFLLSEEVERQHIAKAIASLERSVGRRPVGWCCRTGPSIHTRSLLVEAGGFLYDSDVYNDELPYWIDVDGTPHLTVPYTHTHNDSKYAPGPFVTSTDYETWHRDGFDWLYREGAAAPKMMSVGLHARMIGHPARMAGLARFLDHIVRRGDVWICERVEIARHWHVHHPARSGQDQSHS